MRFEIPLRFAALVLLTTGCGADVRSAVHDAELIITDVNVVDAERGETTASRTVTVRDGRITGVLAADAAADAIADRRTAAGPGDAPRIIDGDGRYLIPGLWDMHVHFRGGEELAEANRRLLPLFVANGVTTVRDAGGDITERILEWREQIEAGREAGPRILTSGPKLDGPTGGWDGSIRPASANDVPTAIDSLESLGADYVKIYDGSISADVYLAIIEEAERRGLVVTGHMPFSVRFLDAVEHGLDATEHLYYAFKGAAANEDSITAAVAAPPDGQRPLGFWNALGLLMPRYEDERARATFRRMAEAGTAAVPTLHIGRVLSWIEETDHAADPELRYIDPAIEATYAGRVRSAERSSRDSREERRALQRRFIEMVPVIHEEGVRILAGSDAGPFNSYVYPGFSLHAELEELVAAGLPVADVLRTATLGAAAFMGMDHEYGRVAPGYRADLVLLEEDPLDRITNTRTVHTVVLRGEAVYGPAELEGLLEAVARPDETVALRR